MLTSLPNLLTVSRILVIPPIVALFWIDGAVARWICLGLFIAGALTDILDGYAARSMGQISKFGRFLDPIADKLLVGSVILMLVAFDRLNGLAILPGLVILCREILVSGLREFLAEVKIHMPVSRLAKWKTAIQMTALGFLIVGDAGPEILPTVLIGEILLWAAALLTMITGYDYLHAGLAHVTDATPPAQSKPRGTIDKAGGGGAAGNAN